MVKAELLADAAYLIGRTVKTQQIRLHDLDAIEPHHGGSVELIWQGSTEGHRGDAFS
jgi:hypothetical protein